MGSGNISGSSDDELITDINVTPLVDIVLVLLIVFMLTADLMDRQSIGLDLPKAATGQSAESSTIGITLSNAGVLYLNGQEIDESALQKACKTEIDNNPEIQALITADKNVPHGRVMQIMDLVRQVGLYRFAISIDPEGG